MFLHRLWEGKFCHLERFINITRKRGIYRLPGVAHVFSALNSNRSDLQIEIDKESRENKAVSLYHGLCQFIRMPFGLKIRHLRLSK